jgi:hypothetical protein
MKKIITLVFATIFSMLLISCGDNSSNATKKAEVITGQENILSDLIFGKTTADKLAITHLNKRFEFMGQITGRTTEGNATIVSIENGRAICSFTDQQQRLAVSDIGRSCWLWTGTLTSADGGRLKFDNCSFRACP